MPQEIPAPVASPRGKYNVGDEVTMYGATFKVTGFRQDGSPVLEMTSLKGQQTAKPEPVKPGGPTVRVVGPKGVIYEMTKNEADDWTTKHPNWRTMPAKKQAEAASKYDPNTFAGGLFGPPKGLEWLMPGTHMGLRALKTGFGAEQKLGEAGTKAVDTLGQRGTLSPGMTGAARVLPGMVESAGRIGGGMSTPGNALLTAGAMHPVGRLLASLVAGGTGGKAMYEGAKGGLKDPDNMEKFLLGGSGVAAGVAGVSESAPKVPGSLKPSPETLARQGSELFTKGTSVAKPDFAPKLDRAVQRGHLPEIERQYHPSTVRDAYQATSDYMNKMVERDVKMPLKGQSGIIKGDTIAEGLQKLKTEETDAFSPEDIKTIENEIDRYKGKDVQMSVAYEHLKRLNQMTSRLRKATPQDAAGAARVNARIRANVAAASILREQLYAKAKELGQPIQDFNEDYGALTTVAQQLYKNIGRAEKIGKGDPLYKEYLRGHGAWMLGLGLEESARQGSVIPGALGVGVPFLRWVAQRRGVPNAMIDRAFGKFGKTGFQPQAQAPPPPAAGQLPRPAIPLGPQQEPIEDVGPMGQKPGTAFSREPGGKPTGGHYTTSGADRPPVQEHEARPPEPPPAPPKPGARKGTGSKPPATGAGVTQSEIDPSKIPPVSGGSQKSETVGSAEGAAADTNDFNTAKRILGPKANDFSLVARVAQELKYIRNSTGEPREAMLKMFQKFQEEGGGKGTYTRDSRSFLELLDHLKALREKYDPKK